MKRNIILIYLIITLISCSTNQNVAKTNSKLWNKPPKNCTISDSSQWENVNAAIMKKKHSPKWLTIQGEGILELSNSVNQIQDIPKHIIKEMKVKAARYGSCSLFIDLNDFYGSDMFPTRKENKVYFYWGVPK